ncbi:neuropeptide S receptor-like, partial [Convolutriloba macropyga]
ARALVQVVAPACTSFLLVSMACDRYYAIVLNTRHQHQNLIMVSTSWLLSIVLSLPQLYGFGLNEHDSNPGKVYCEAKKSWLSSFIFPFYLGTVFLFVVIIPTATNAFCYGRALYYLYGSKRVNIPVRNSVAETRNLITQRENSTKLAIAIVVSYLGCWLPYFIGAFLAVFAKVHLPPWVYTITEGLAMLNSLINPLLCCGYSTRRKNVVNTRARNCPVKVSSSQI